MTTSVLKLPASLEEFVALQVRQGTYRSREAAIVAAVSQHKRRTEQRAWLNSKLEQGLKSGSAGALDVDSVIQRGRRRQSARAARARS